MNNILPWVNGGGGGRESHMCRVSQEVVTGSKSCQFSLEMLSTFLEKLVESFDKAMAGCGF